MEVRPTYCMQQNCFRHLEA